MFFFLFFSQALEETVRLSAGSRRMCVTLYLVFRGSILNGLFFYVNIRTPPTVDDTVNVRVATFGFPTKERGLTRIPAFPHRHQRLIDTPRAINVLSARASTKKCQWQRPNGRASPLRISAHRYEFSFLCSLGRTTSIVPTQMASSYCVADVRTKQNPPLGHRGDFYVFPAQVSLAPRG